MSVKCEFCGFEHKEDPGKFCDRCGRVIERLNINMEEEDNKKVCLKCGHRNPGDHTICDNCGEVLHSPRLG